MPTPDDGSSRLVIEGMQRLDAALTPSQIAWWCGVDVSLVYHWQSGARTMGVWALRRLIRGQGDARGALAELASAGGCAVVRLPEGPTSGRDVLLSVMEIQEALGRLAGTMVVLASPASSSDDLNTADRCRIRAHIAPLLHQLIALDSALQEDRRG